MEQQPDNFNEKYIEGIANAFKGDSKSQEEREEAWRKLKEEESKKFDTSNTTQGEMKFD